MWTPRYREKVLADNYIKAELGRIFKTIAKWKDFVIRAWHIGDDHIHLVVDIPPNYSISYVGVDEMTIQNYVKHQEHHQVNIQKLPL